MEEEDVKKNNSERNLPMHSNFQAFDTVYKGISVSYVATLQTYCLLHDEFMQKSMITEAGWYKTVVTSFLEQPTMRSMNSKALSWLIFTETGINRFILSTFSYLY